jgi:hypothetical protein
MSDIPTNIISNRMAYLDANAKPLAQGRLMIYNAGSSTGLANIYADSALSMLIPNPIMLDSAGRAPSLYAGVSVYVKVEKYIGMDEHGNRLYDLVYDFETPPGVDISSYWNLNVVETYDELREIGNTNPTWVTGEGNAHLYVWNENRPSGLNEVIDVSSIPNPGGSWHWETKEVHADQCSIRNDGSDYDNNRWETLASISTTGIKAVIPAGSYSFAKERNSITFGDVEIRHGVFFLSTFIWEWYVRNKVECHSLHNSLKIAWRKLPPDKIYDEAYFGTVPAAEMSYNENISFHVKDQLVAENGLVSRGSLQVKNKIIIGDLEITATDYNMAAKFDLGSKTHNIHMQRGNAVFTDTVRAGQVIQEPYTEPFTGETYAIPQKEVLAKISLDTMEVDDSSDNQSGAAYMIGRYFPIGSYIVCHRDKRLQLGQVVYGRGTTNYGKNLRVWDSRDAAGTESIFGEFVVCGFTGYGELANYEYDSMARCYLLRRVG